MSPPLCKGERLRDIGHSMSIRNLILVVDSVTVSYLIHLTVYYKIRKILLQNATTVLLQNATEVYCKMRRDSYYKMRELLQNATFITNATIQCFQ